VSKYYRGMQWVDEDCCVSSHMYFRKGKKKMILIGKLEVGGKRFSMKDSEGTVYPKQLGLPDNFYGGYASEYRKTIYGIYLVLNRKGDIINLGYTEESLTAEGRELLGRKSSIPDAPVYNSIGETAEIPPEAMLEFEPFIKPQEIITPKKKEPKRRNL